ncbi:PREDICTED: uncharacterized protein LOC104817876 isoform X2 [Tarenaya hassleriana]|uniref:uncharacterized protein LOC104817876 isoform X2 n=1 Tax=Tarenaya hassleriana TaxID=28532 RepID=UPI00053C1CC8|nr:PREDICTED: uncharacterized protein LOC104817876 isoform X2 [Tarenaya hassleriana]
MASDLYIFGGGSSSSSICRHSSPEMFSSDTTVATDLPFLRNNDLYPSYLDALNSITDNSYNPVDESLCLFDHFAPPLLSSSPPSHQLESLTLSQPIHSNSAVFSNGFQDFSGFGISDVKTELFFDASGYNQTGAAALMARSYSAVENVGKYMQRSFSSNSVEAKPGFQFNYPLVEPSNLHNQTLSSPENGFLSGHMRRVCSTGDLQSTIRNLASQRSYSSENSSSPFTEEPNFRIGRYSVEERKERISKYRAKRTQRNFTKTIKENVGGQQTAYTWQIRSKRRSSRRYPQDLFFFCEGRRRRRSLEFG